MLCYFCLYWIELLLNYPPFVCGWGRTCGQKTYVLAHSPVTLVGLILMCARVCFAHGHCLPNHLHYRYIQSHYRHFLSAEYLEYNCWKIRWNNCEFALKIDELRSWLGKCINFIYIPRLIDGRYSEVWGGGQFDMMCRSKFIIRKAIRPDVLKIDFKINSITYMNPTQTWDQSNCANKLRKVSRKVKELINLWVWLWEFHSSLVDSVRSILPNQRQPEKDEDDDDQK